MRNRFDLAKLAAKRRSKVRPGQRIKTITHNRASERAYRREMRRLVRDVARSLSVVPSDATMSTLATEARRILAEATPQTIGGVERILNVEASSHRKKWIKAVRATIGIDLSRVVRGSDIEQEWGLIVRRNVRLIKDVSDDVVKRVDLVVQRATLNGESASRVSKRLQEQFGIVGRRADVIARDQIATAVGDLNKLRQEQAGIKQYVWVTSADERVRPEHEALDGKVFRWDKPGPDNGLHPGQPILCRCTAGAVLEVEAD